MMRKVSVSGAKCKREDEAIEIIVWRLSSYPKDDTVLFRLPRSAKILGSLIITDTTWTCKRPERPNQPMQGIEKGMFKTSIR